MSGDVQNVGSNSVNNNYPLPQGGNEKANLDKKLTSIFNKIDTNHDGRISEEEMKDNKPLYDIIQNLVGENIFGKDKKITLKRLLKLGDSAKTLIVNDFYAKEENEKAEVRSSELARQSVELANMSTAELQAINNRRKEDASELMAEQNIKDRAFDEVNESIHKKQEPKFGLD